MDSRQYLTEQQYKTDANLAARQSIYAYQQPHVHLAPLALAEALSTGKESVLDVGCGNGLYIGELYARGHAGTVIGMDLSPGMIDAAHARVSRTPFLRADAEALPFPDESFDVVLAMHMLYHVSDRARGIAELRRVLRDGGTLLVVTNSDLHIRELDEIVVAAAGRSLPSNRLTFTLESGGEELAESFEFVERRDYPSELVITEVEPVLNYVRSMHAWVSGDEQLEGIAEEIARRVGEVVDRDGAFRVRTQPGYFVCR